MRFAACLKKDIRLLTGGGLRSLLFLLLPVLLAFIMAFGMRSMAKVDLNTVSFNIAVRDEDDTVMSRLLMTQLDKVSLFKTVIRAGGKTDGELHDMGCAAVVTIPKDFFYDLYDMEDTDVVIALNADMPAEAAMVRSAFTSLVGILEENQRVHYAAARVRFGELDDAEMAKVYHDYSNAAVEDALGRLDFFSLGGVYEKSYDGAKLFFASGILSMIIMFIPLSMLRSISEELSSGLSARFRVTGGHFFEALLSKLLIAFVMTAAPSAAIILLLKVGQIGVLAPILIACFLLSFAFFLFVSGLSKDAATAQLAGNLIMLLVLTVGGALYPYVLLPDAVRSIGRFMPPRVIMSALQYASMGMGLSPVKTILLIYLGAAALLFIASLPLLRARRRA